MVAILDNDNMKKYKTKRNKYEKDYLKRKLKDSSMAFWKENYSSFKCTISGLLYINNYVEHCLICSKAT